MPLFSIGQRLKIALGGFVCFLGAIVFVSSILIVTGAIETTILLGPASLIIALIISLLNIACGLIFILEDKKIVFSFASNKKKTNNNADQSS